MAVRSLQDSQLTIGVFGDPGVGKTADKVWAFPNGMHIAGETALIPALRLCGFQPKRMVELPNPTLATTREAVKRAVQADKKIDAVCIDDMSNTLMRTARSLEATIKDGRAMYKTLAHHAQEAIDEWVSLGLHVAVDFHVQQPKFVETPQKDGSVLRGRMIKKGEPLSPGNMIGPAVVSLFETFLRVVPDPMRTDWPYGYSAGPDADGAEWLTKDRWNVVRGTVPMNLGEIFRDAGKVLPRPPGWEWQEGAIEAITQNILGGAQEAIALADAVRQMRAAGKSMFEIRGLVRDVRARVFLRRRGSDAEQLKQMGIYL